MHSRFPRLFVQRVHLPHLLAANSHQGLGRGDAPDPAPQVTLATVLLDVSHDLEKRLLQHVLGIFGPPQNPPDEIVDRRLEGPV